MKGFQRIQILLVGALIAACASRYKNPESISEKISRFSPKNTTFNKTPSYEIPSKIKSSPRARSIASVDMPISKNTLAHQSNKRIYFLTLLSQYKNLKTYLDVSGPEINNCPNFHSSILRNTIKTNTSAKGNPFKTVNIPKDKLSQKKHPELYLPLTHEELRPRVVDFIGKENEARIRGKLYTALKIHVEKNYKELNELCEYGESSNYFIFENLITHMKSKDLKKGNSIALKTLLKSPVYSNMYLLNSLNKMKRGALRSPASLKKPTRYEKEMMRRMKSQWAYGLFFNILKN